MIGSDPHQVAAEPSGEKRRPVTGVDEVVARTTHVILFSLTGAALFLAFLLGGIHHVFPAADIGRLPLMCGFRRWTGLPCPGCGLTRSWIALAEFDLRSSLRFHRLGWLVMLYVFLQATRHGAWLWLKSQRTRVDRFGFWLDRAFFFLAAALFLNWFVTLAS